MTQTTDPERALALGTRTRAGAYRLDLTTQQWWWSDEVYAIHGFAPHEVVPTTELLLAHKHPEDRGRSVAALDEASRTGAPFSSVHRIVDARGRERVVAVVGEGQGHTALGTPTELVGYFVDVTDVVDDRAQAAATVSIAAAAESRSVIDQAVGVVAFVEEVDPAAAFLVLRAASNDANVPIRVLARAIVGALPTLRHDPARVTHFLEGLLSPAHRQGAAGA
ncbi:PAS and ANTAR domain-containing protein [Cellulomonas pakistanensis]|uniref:histidine kinase n=1 Tax=Cellulomonas pakistanensis TaxID=992287 RepID=A0A919PAE9_9CELL|nr:PAS and ANTAR domain-containing protein [Cellulomonas pakistanensis]GIG35017.1 putative transcription antitermination regulator [Cellulomonas pakistanensis]